MNSAIEELVRSLLYEGYALYPYTPGVKNATPTPFGIVYPPDYAEAQPAAFSMLRLEAVLQGGPDALLSGTALFLQATGERHEAAERSLELGPVTLAELAREPMRETVRLPARRRRRAQRSRRDASRAALADARPGPALRPQRDRDVMGPDRGLPRRGASPQPDLHPPAARGRGRTLRLPARAGGAGRARRRSPASPSTPSPCCWARRTTALLGAAIVLPDHPELAPESLGNLFDNTEIEEALLLHVHALSDDEREQIAGQDPAVREMIERAESTTGEEIMGLHGRLTYTEPEARGSRRIQWPPALAAARTRRDPGGEGDRGCGDDGQAR